MNQLITIRDRRQITIPRKFLHRFGLGIGDKFIIKLDSGQIMMEPIKIKTVDLLSKIQQVVQDADLSEGELQETASRWRKEQSKL